MNSAFEKLGGIVKAARQKKNLTQRQLAERLSITRQHLISIENKQQIPSISLLFQIIRELNLSADAIFYPELGHDRELVNKLLILSSRLDEHDVELVISILQMLSQAKSNGEVVTRCSNKFQNI